MRQEEANASTGPVVPAGPGVDDRQGLVAPVFGLMWAIAALTHLANQTDGLHTLTGWAAAGAAVYLMGRPGSPDRLALLAMAQLADLAWEWPFAPDHWLLGGAVNLLILGRYLASPGSRPHLVARVAPGARLLLLLAYTAAAMSKWNTEFLDPVHSCAVQIADAAAFGLVTGPAAVDWVHIVVAVVAETSVAVLLWVPRTRWLGVRVGVIFHFVVSLSPAVQVADFSTPLYALFVLFLPVAQLGTAVDWVRGVTAHSPIARLVMRRRLVAGSLLVLTAGGLGHLHAGYRSAIVWGAVTSYGVIIILALLKSASAGRTVRRIGRPGPIDLAVVALLMVHILNPYVGLRTVSTFNMFSNLRTEGPGDNHLFLPSGSLFDYQDDLAAFVSSNDPELQELADDGQAAPFFELQRLVGEDPELVVEVRHRGQTVRYGQGPGLVDPGETSWISRKLLLFHHVADTGDPPCIN